MNLNQAFEILSKYTNRKYAKLILSKKKINFISLLYIIFCLKKGMPLSKIINEKEFYGLNFYTNKWTLDPRSDSETLVDAVLNSYKNKDIDILDLGTGTGCLILSILYNNKNAKGIAIDKSNKAIKIAKKNAKNLDLINRCIFKQADFTKDNFDKFDVVISNPPYISKKDPNVDKSALFDPKIALFSKHNGLYFYEILSKRAEFWLKNDGSLFIEIGYNQKKDVIDIFKTNNWLLKQIYNDLSNIPRVLHFIKE